METTTLAEFPLWTARVGIYNVITEKLTPGVPQGLTLGPLLLVIYCNNLPDVVTTTQLVLYADDTSVVAPNKDTDQFVKLLQDNLRIVFGLWTELSINKTLKYTI